MALEISSAPNRHSTSWVVESLAWPELVDRLRQTVRTRETVKQFVAMRKDDQDKVKDVGGFVGGRLVGKRRADGVLNRWIITLDADYCDQGFIDTVESELPNVAWCIYSTHKHTPQSPRLRLVIPLNRSVSPEQYEPIARRLSAQIGMGNFDPTTYQAARLMYWPSTPSDGEFFFKENKGDSLNADYILGTYSDWRDVDSWPVHDTEKAIRAASVDKQAEPTTKPGIVGAFCRVYSIDSAIAEFVPDYQQSDKGRYTYKPGSTSNGVAVYDGKFSYSHHATDPAGGQLCNAFDLVRIHRFGKLDNDAKDKTPPHKMPSFREMARFAEGLPKVKMQLVQDIVGEFEDFTENPEKPAEKDKTTTTETTEASPEWQSQLRMKGEGFEASFYNAVLITRHWELINKKPRRNEFTLQTENETGEFWTNNDTSRIRELIGNVFQIDFAVEKIESAIELRADENPHHPVREYLNSLVWDGVPRVERLFIDWLKAADNEYTREAARCWLVAAVKRVFEPGIKFDYVPLLIGHQGIGKSTFGSILARGWYGELNSFDADKAVEAMQGAWILEIPEMAATSKHEIEEQKQFLSSQFTRVRLAYARRAIEFKRQCVFYGTSNNPEPLKDTTGNRRWWPIYCGLAENRCVDFKALRSAVDAIWAEAVVLYRGGADIVMAASASALAGKQQADALESDEWDGVISAWLNSPARVDRYEGGIFTETDETEQREKVCIAEVWEDCLKGSGGMRRADRLRIAAILDRYWIRAGMGRFGNRFGIQKCWEPPVE